MTKDLLEPIFLGSVYLSNEAADTAELKEERQLASRPFRVRP